MLAATLLAMNLLGQAHIAKAKITTHHYRVHEWRVIVRNDAFSGAPSCTIKAPRIAYRRQTLIFHVGGADTTHAFFRVDNGAPARSVREAFTEDEARGFFPERGWIVDPNGGEVALPATYLTSAKRIYIRVSLKSHPRAFDVSRFPEALSRARAAGCTDKTID